MRIAVLGVGLIGGSIGLASRGRLGARVVGFDPDPGILERALELGAIDEVTDSPAAAAAAAEIAFCAAPVRELPGLVEAALAAGGDAVVSDVGSTKRELVSRIASLPDAERFIGGHPIAGAESAGVEHARADLFDGARWYLTPTPNASGVHYDRLQRTITEIGARPQAIDAESHDRLLATVSHLPHVLANVLVDQAVAAASEESERLPEAGPSFRDATRVAGSNPRIWADIFASNADVVGAEIDAVIERLREAAEVIRSGDRDRILAWQREARSARARLLEGARTAGPLRELRASVENRPGTLAELALALGKAGVNIEDMALYPAPDMRTGAVTMWVAGDAEAERAADIVRSLGHSVDIVSEGQ
ncbi:MAG TPA: prephenate dehydrogenase/arogenate dehydrogenase family protein [Solirubrobacterales bacterium]